MSRAGYRKNIVDTDTLSFLFLFHHGLFIIFSEVEFLSLGL